MAGKKVTITGVFGSGKLGWFVTTNGWQIDIYATNDASAKEKPDLNRFLGHRVRATGTLLYRAGSNPPPDEQGVPEHFCFDISEVKIVGLARTRSKR